VAARRCTLNWTIHRTSVVAVSFRAPTRSDKLAVQGMHDGLKPIMGAQLLVDVVEMVAERLQCNPKRFSDLGRILAFGESAEDALFLFGK
jgi:hypothetical protein